MSDTPKKQVRKTWFSSGVFKGGIERVDREAHALRGVTLCNVGEAKGHGVWLDSVFVASVGEHVKAKQNGLKCRLAHPGMCADGTGTFLGKVKLSAKSKAAFRGGQAPASDSQRYDLFLSSAAEDAPGKGDIRNWVETMAEKDPDMCGFSIVFRRDWDTEEDFHVANGAQFKWRLYDKGQRTEGVCSKREEIPEGADYYVDMAGFKSPDAENVNNFEHARLLHLHAADIVDDPAATDGLFSEGSTSALAEQMTEFLDLHPEVLQALQSPAILDVLKNRPEVVETFLAKYKAHKQEETTMSEQSVKPEATKPETPAAAVSASAAPAAAVPAAAPEPAKPDALAEISAKVTSLEAQLKAKDDEIAQLKAANEALLKGEKPVSASAAPAAGAKTKRHPWQ